MNLLKISFAVLFSFCCTIIFSQPQMIEADNGVLKIKLDLTRGGAICYVSLSGSDQNLVNIFDEGDMIKITNRLTCFRHDTIYGDGVLRDQELPAVYPISKLSNLCFYKGEKPFTQDTLSSPEVVNLASGFWGKYPGVTEHWMAFVDDDMFGMGVYNPECTYFLAGMSGKPGHGTKSASTSYIAPVKKAALMKDSVFEYTYYIIIGKLDDIRKNIYRLQQ